MATDVNLMVADKVSVMDEGATNPEQRTRTAQQYILPCDVVLGRIRLDILFSILHMHESRVLACLQLYSYFLERILSRHDVSVSSLVDHFD